MKCKYYKRDKMTQIILDLIWLHYEMLKDGHTDRQSLLEIERTIDTLKYYRQFLPKEN